MKKIVALVLSLVLALSLCATAFAASTSQDLYSLDDGKHSDELICKGIDYVKASTKVPNIGYYAGWYTQVESKCYVLEKYDGAKLVDTIYVCEEDYAADSAKTPVGPYRAWADKLVNEGYTYKLDADQKPVFVTAYADGDCGHYVPEYGIPCEQSVADAAVHNNGRIVDFVYLTTDWTEAVYKYTATAQAATSAKPNCTVTQYKEDGFVDENGWFYIEADGKNGTKLNVDGKIVFAIFADNDDDYVIHASHIFAKGVKNDKTGYDVATCLICKGEFACTNNDVVATKNGYKISTGFSYYVDDAAKVYDANKFANGYDFSWGQTYANDYKFCWQLKPGTTEEIGTKPSTDKKTGVDSAKTFDAGIAMYVGMSLLSVAGSAVVIGKKKEF